MGEVIELRPRAAASNDEQMAVLASMMAKDTAGELHGSIVIGATKNGTEIHILGACADRLQMGVLAMVRGLNYVCDQIVAKGTAGNTQGDGPIKLQLPNPRKTLPKRLREATNFGELE